MLENPNDKALIEGCLKSRKESWDIFVERFSRLIHWSIRKTLEDSSFRGRADLPQEIFQELFVKLLERNELERLRDAESIRKFLSVAACHLTMDKLKKLIRSEKKIAEAFLPNADEDLDASEWIKDEASDPALKAVNQERNLLIAQTLQDLSKKERLCVEWHYLEGKTHKEISEILGLPMDNISSAIRRIRERLKKIFLEKGLLE